MRSENFNEGKENWTLLLGDMQASLRELLKVRQYGAEKYDRHNWERSIGTEDAPRFRRENLESILRHVMSWADGQLIDDETGRHHALNIAMRCLFEVEYYLDAQGEKNE